VRAALVERPEEYKWSSAAAHLGLAKDRYSLLDKEFWTENGGAGGWADLLAAPEDVLDTRLLRRCTYAGRPFGETSTSRWLKSSFSGSGGNGASRKSRNSRLS
jgi:putative transposase